ncbi:MAG: hypothetical protein HONDAALG_01585 [Gammaproteobacteria bacterium]|nr:hypothetical protein [Gammaproteobacteria bacterium]
MYPRFRFTSYFRPRLKRLQIGKLLGWRAEHVIQSDEVLNLGKLIESRCLIRARYRPAGMNPAAKASRRHSGKYTVDYFRTEALRQAQLEMKKKYPNPFFWGAFICRCPRKLERESGSYFKITTESTANNLDIPAPLLTTVPVTSTCLFSHSAASPSEICR